MENIRLCDELLVVAASYDRPPSAAHAYSDTYIPPIDFFKLVNISRDHCKVEQQQTSWEGMGMDMSAQLPTPAFARGF